MDEKPSEAPRRLLILKTITKFIADRRDTKLNGKEDPATAAKYEYSTWLADAARRVTQIQAVTHVLKATHPDARGSSLFIEPRSLPHLQEIGSHSLTDHFATDIVGNAAALDVYKFLKLQVDGRPLLDWLQDDDPDLLAALSSEPLQAAAWSAAFKGLIRTAEPLVSHEKAKQLYWCVDGMPTQDSSFHLLQPLFPSSLAHAIHSEINDARFGESNKIARQAWRSGQEYDSTYREYRNLVARKLGGTKPQNISQLNSERGGVNYLLSSLPPTWNRPQVKPLLLIDSAFQRFYHFEGVQQQLNALYNYFQQDPSASFDTRKRRERIERALGLALTAFGLSVRSQSPAGWTQTSDCRLPQYECAWLDPGRASLPIREGFEEEDLEFQRVVQGQEWPKKVAERFALWLNVLLLNKGFSVSDSEHMHWARKALTHTRDFAPAGQEVSHA